MLNELVEHLTISLIYERNTALICIFGKRGDRGIGKDKKQHKKVHYEYVTCDALRKIFDRYDVRGFF